MKLWLAGPAALLLALAFSACASSEGGVVGTGISASVAGNVSLVSEDTSTAAATLPTIEVGIAGLPDFSTSTDVDGNFTLTGEFAGAIQLRFAAQGGEIGELPIEVSPGSSTVLENIEIRLGAPAGERVQPAAVKQFDVSGQASMVECADDGSGTLLVDPASSDAVRQVLVRVFIDTEFRRGDDEAIDCADVQNGAKLLVNGVLASDGALEALRVIVAPRVEPDVGQRVRPVDVRGRVAAVDCQVGIADVEDLRVGRPIRQRVRLLPATEITCASDGGRACTCADIRTGDLIDAAGTIALDRPGAVDADAVLVAAAPQPVQFSGVLVRALCAARALQVNAVSLLPQPQRRLRVELAPSTAVLCGGRACTCTDLRPGAAIDVEGMFDVDHPSVVRAATVSAEVRRVGGR